MSKRRSVEMVVLWVVAGCGHSSEHREPAREPGHESGSEHSAHKPGSDHSGHFAHRFDDAERWAKVFDDPARDPWQKPEEVIRLCALETGMTAVDIGAGTGYFVPHLSRAVGDTGAVIGLDVEADMVRYLNERIAAAKLGNASARVVSGSDPGLAAGSVDRILVVNTWHHIPDRAAYSAKLRAALRPGGVVVVVDYTREAPRGPPARHRIPAEVVIRELAAGGLRAEVATESLPHQYVVVGFAPSRQSTVDSRQ